MVGAPASQARDWPPPSGPARRRSRSRSREPPRRWRAWRHPPPTRSGRIRAPPHTRRPDAAARPRARAPSRSRRWWTGLSRRAKPPRLFHIRSGSAGRAASRSAESPDRARECAGEDCAGWRARDGAVPSSLAGFGPSPCRSNSISPFLAACALIPARTRCRADRRQQPRAWRALRAADDRRRQRRHLHPARGRCLRRERAAGRSRGLVLGAALGRRRLSRLAGLHAWRAPTDRTVAAGTGQDRRGNVFLRGFSFPSPIPRRCCSSAPSFRSS